MRKNRLLDGEGIHDQLGERERLGLNTKKIQETYRWMILILNDLVKYKELAGAECPCFCLEIQPDSAKLYKVAERLLKKTLAVPTSIKNIVKKLRGIN